MVDTSVDLAGLSEAELSQYRTDLVERFSRVEMEVEMRRKQGQLHIKNALGLPWQSMAPWVLSMKTEITWKPLVMPERGFPVHNMYSFLVHVPPHSKQGKYHIHGEAIKFYLKGKGIEHIGDQTFEVEAGDVMFVPANVWHGTENPYDEAIEFYGVQMLDGTYLQKPALIASASE